MPLDETDRWRVWAELMRDWPEELQPCPDVDKDELRAAVDAADDWIDTAQQSYHDALPAVFQAEATAPQKAFVLAYLMMRRTGLLHSQDDLAVMMNGDS